MRVGDINLNPGPITTINNNNMRDNLLLRNCNLSIDWNKKQISFDSDNPNSGNK